MSELEIMPTPELLAYVKRLELENAELRQLAELWPSALEAQENLKLEIKRLQTELAKTYRIVDQGQAILCLTCGRTSYSRGDIEHCYCGYCESFHQPVLGGCHEQVK